MPTNSGYFENIMAINNNDFIWISTSLANEY